MLHKILFTVFIFSFCSAMGQNEKTFIIPCHQNKASVLEIDIEINHFPARFIFDPGATTVSFSKLLYDSLVEQGYLNASDIKYKTKTRMANGELSDAWVLNITNLTLGNLTLKNVEAMIMSGTNVPSLMGQSVLQKFSTVTIDYSNSTIVVKTKNTVASAKLDKLKFIPCSADVLSEVENLKAVVPIDSSLTIGTISQEQKIPPPAALNRLHNKITIRYFDEIDIDKAEALKAFFVKMGYAETQISSEDMTRLFAAPISGYIEVWIK